MQCLGVFLKKRPDKKETDEDALLMSFNRKNPNLEWQEEDEEILNSAQSTLRCEANK